ncbi:MAG: hypothetical protein AAB547_03210 [Patescibacteria group bacterium]
MSPFESLPQKMPENKAEPKETLQDKARKWGGRLVVAAALGVPLAGQATEVPEKVAEPVKAERVVHPKENRTQIAARLEEARYFMRIKLDSLGVFSGGPDFIEEVKKNAGGIRTFLDNPAAAVQFPLVLGEIVTKYAPALAEAKKYAPDLYRENVKRFQQALEVVENKPITQVKQDLAALF